jgi:hypothetical protein
MGQNGCLMFCQIIADEERRVSHCIVMVQHPNVFPTIQASSCAQHPPNALKHPGTTVCGQMVNKHSENYNCLETIQKKLFKLQSTAWS